MLTDKPIYHEIKDDEIIICCPDDKWKIEISTTEEYRKMCGFLYITLRRKDKKEPSIAQWIYRHLPEVQLALHVIQLKLKSPEKRDLYLNLGQLLDKMNLWDAIDEAKLFKEIAAAKLPFAASIQEKVKHPNILETSRDIIEQYGDSYFLHKLSLTYNKES